MISLICEILKRKSEQIKQNKDKPTGTENRLVVTRVEGRLGGWGGTGEGGQLYGDRW